MGMASSKATTVVARTFQTIRPHIPAIKFGRIQEQAKTNTDVNFVPTVVSMSSAVDSNTNKSNVTKVGKTPRGSGTDSSELPSRFHRKPITEDEMEYIEKGGQV